MHPHDFFVFVSLRDLTQKFTVTLHILLAVMGSLETQSHLETTFALSRTLGLEDHCLGFGLALNVLVPSLTTSTKNKCYS